MLCRKQTPLPRCSPLTLSHRLACTSQDGFALMVLYCSQSFVTAVLLCSLAASHSYRVVPNTSLSMTALIQLLCTSQEALLQQCTQSGLPCQTQPASVPCCTHRLGQAAAYQPANGALAPYAVSSLLQI